ncbi:hypothetical protein B0I35DRAFT_484070 [Stachybotrys elegans]|uniref:Uncharacterized protein n=1 Tax=Stachybotrys elegans TaxID=80388 RepID=A0A8K0SIX5_9HYPO|nr:hypothetical protein B0I35DRAFT_484070 [Stachybotrys elegans]
MTESDWDGDGLCYILSVERQVRSRCGATLTRKATSLPHLPLPSSYRPSGPRAPLVGVWVFMTELSDSETLVTLSLSYRSDGDGRVDYICMKPDAESSAILSTASGYKNLGKIKFAPEGNLDSANFRWADVCHWRWSCGDLIWVDKFNGQARVWKNGGLIPAGAAT